MKRNLLFLCLALASVLAANAVPANPKWRNVRMPDGTERMLRMVGNEHFHYYEDQDGIVYTKDETGVLRATDRDGLQQMRRSPVRVARRAGDVSRASKFPTEGEPHTLVILAEFPDLSFSMADANEAFSRLLNEEGYAEGGASGSARDYFKDNSGGRFQPNFDVVGPVCMPNNMRYYGENDPLSDDDIRAQEIIADACKAVDAEVDFSQYDYDNDGRVDNVFVVYAGYSEADGGSADCIWPHEWNLEDAQIDLSLDGKQIYSYACTNELIDGVGATMVGIGTFCHEFSHVLGLLDLYTTDGSSAFTPGDWSVMDVGSYNNDGRTPPYMSAFERLELGWIEPKELTLALAAVELPSIASNEAYILNTSDPDEYFLFENRQQEDWDAYVPGHGMLVWHIDYDEMVWNMSTINNDYMHQHVDIVEADGIQSEHTAAGDAFPGTSNVTSLNANTMPALLSWAGTPFDLQLSNIREEGGIIRFDVTEEEGAPDAPVALPASMLTPTSFVAKWEKAGNASYRYELFVAEEGSDAALPGYDWWSVGYNDSAFVVNLSAMTDYYYKVRVRNGIYLSEESEAMQVSTPDFTFEFLAPAVLAASEVDETSFTARWEPMEGAVSYFVNVYSEQESGVTYRENNFSNNLSMPSGWSTTCTRTNSIAGYYGAASPSLRYEEEGQYLETPSSVSAPYRSVSFWYRASNTGDDASLEILGLQGEEWVTVDEVVSPTKDEGGAVYSNESLPDGISRLRLVYHSTRGALMVDDVKIGTAAYDWKVMEGYESLAAGSDVSLPVSGLSVYTDYQYAVRAFDGEVYSRWSDWMLVHTSPAAGCTERPACGLQASVLPGCLLLSGADADTVYAVYAITGTMVSQGTVRAGSICEVPLPEGVYIVSTREGNQKVIIM